MLQELDTQLLLFLNGFHNPFWDHFMWNYTSKLAWIPLYLVLIGYTIFRWKKQSIWIIAALLLSVAIADYCASGILKPLVARLRPSQVEELQGVLHLINGYKSGMYGFVSSHAANTVGIATLFALLSKDKIASTVLFIWALVNAYSRIYMGVHYPSDILGGCLIGVGAAFVCYYTLKKINAVHLLAQKPNLYASLSIPTAWIMTLLVLLLWAAVH